MRNVPLPALSGLAFALATGCGGLNLPEEETQVLLAITSVPAEIACVRITASGAGRTVAREIEVRPGMSLNESFAGLPLGTVAFKGEAFAAGCDAVTKATTPSWVSDAVPVTVALGRIATVALTLHRNGRAKVSLDFADQPACSAAGFACLTGNECCSQSCLNDVCAMPDAGAGDTHGD